MSTAETNTGILVGRIIPIAIGAAQIACIIVPRPAAQHALLRARTAASSSSCEARLGRKDVSNLENPSVQFELRRSVFQKKFARFAGLKE
ncbi:hypothetical protein HUU05_27870 [candidate division KSB1 bacterium]|nr:hypothetical protein [candidate division KSB1 bacterium]